MSDTLLRHSSANSSMPLLSVIIPVFNEQATVRHLVERVQQSPVEKELVLVDDASTDGTAELLAELVDSMENIRLVTHPNNRGKGAAVHSGIAAAQGEWVIVQDADLEYDPAEYPQLLKPILLGQADVVFGSRFAGGASHQVVRFWHSQGNRLLTLLSNMFSNLKLTDMETCYKVVPRNVLLDLDLQEQRFGIEPELTAKLARYRKNGRPLAIYEVAISYHGRRYEEGKKIGLRDGLQAVWCILKYNLWR